MHIHSTILPLLLSVPHFLSITDTRHCPQCLDMIHTLQSQLKHVSRHKWMLGHPQALYMTLKDCKRTHSASIDPNTSYPFSKETRSQPGTSDLRRHEAEQDIAKWKASSCVLCTDWTECRLCPQGVGHSRHHPSKTFYLLNQSWENLHLL